MERNHCPDLRFDVEGEEVTNNNDPKVYDFLMQFASDPQEGQTQNSDSLD
jgi:hypothetical protein